MRSLLQMCILSQIPSTIGSLVVLFGAFFLSKLFCFDFICWGIVTTIRLGFKNLPIKIHGGTDLGIKSRQSKKKINFKCVRRIQIYS